VNRERCGEIVPHRVAHDVAGLYRVPQCGGGLVLGERSSCVGNIRLSLPAERRPIPDGPGHELNPDGEPRAFRRGSVSSGPRMSPGKDGDATPQCRIAPVGLVPKGQYRGANNDYTRTAARLGWSRGATTGAFSLALVLSGFATIAAGRRLDRQGARLLMTAGSRQDTTGIRLGGGGLAAGVLPGGPRSGL
jgi:hypothetical protein